VTGVQTCALPIWEVWPMNPFVACGPTQVIRTLENLFSIQEAVLIFARTAQKGPRSGPKT
jgi:hypothetical protein